VVGSEGAIGSERTLATSSIASGVLCAACIRARLRMFPRGGSDGQHGGFEDERRRKAHARPSLPGRRASKARSVFSKAVSAGLKPPQLAERPKRNANQEPHS